MTTIARKPHMCCYQCKLVGWLEMVYHHCVSYSQVSTTCYQHQLCYTTSTMQQHSNTKRQHTVWYNELHVLWRAYEQHTHVTGEYFEFGAEWDSYRIMCSGLVLLYTTSSLLSTHSIVGCVQATQQLPRSTS